MQSCGVPFWEFSVDEFYKGEVCIVNVLDQCNCNRDIRWRCFFKRKPPDRLLQISERVYGRQAPRELLLHFTPLNPEPSQLRYLRYISRRNLGSDWPPSDTPLTLDCIILRVLPIYGEKGCRPVVRIYGQDSSSTPANRSSKLLFASSNTKKHAGYYQPELMKIDIHHRIQGDVILECIHMDEVNEEMIFRVMFHTAFVRSNILMLSRDEVDVMWDARDQFSKNFKAEVLFKDDDVRIDFS